MTTVQDTDSFVQFDGLLPVHPAGEFAVTIARQLRDQASWFSSQNTSTGRFIAGLLNDAAKMAEDLQANTPDELTAALKWSDNDILENAKLQAWNEGYGRAFETFRYRKNAS